MVVLLGNQLILLLTRDGLHLAETTFAVNREAAAMFMGKMG
jgi:hypothetical protein